MNKYLKGAILFVIVAIALVAVNYRLSTKPDCNCFYPNSGRYGVLSGGGECVVSECVQRKKQEPPSPGSVLK
ncbi:MAG TPA: hypothetical protein VF588_07285 [Pyrinomonadaceae bacterium]|jgi:hypothetical protein